MLYPYYLFGRGFILLIFVLSKNRKTMSRFKKGDILVRDNSGLGNLYHCYGKIIEVKEIPYDGGIQDQDNTNHSDITVRHATLKEIEAYENGIKNISAIKETFYEFNKGDIVVCIYGKTFGRWLEDGEIVELGGEYWEKNTDLERKLIDKRNRISCTSKEFPKGNGGKAIDGEIIFRRATIKEEVYYREKGLGANVKDMPESKEKDFPSHGWCPNPSDKVIKYISNRFNRRLRVNVGKRGFAWKGETNGVYKEDFPPSVWEIQGGSGYTQYDTKELEKLISNSFDWGLTPLPKREKTNSTYDWDLFIDDYKPNNRDSIIASEMAMSHSKKSNEFAQQKPIIIRKKKKKFKLIIS